MGCGGCAQRAKTIAAKMGYLAVWYDPISGHYVTDDELEKEHSRRTVEMVFNKIGFKLGKRGRDEKEG